MGNTGTQDQAAGGAGVAIPPFPNQWYSLMLGTGAGVALVSVNEPQYVPFVANAQHTWQSIGFVVTTLAAGSTCRLAIYADNGSGYPGALVLDVGEQSVAAAGNVVVAINQALAPGLYWLGIVPHGAAVPSVTGGVHPGPTCYNPLGGNVVMAEPAANTGGCLTGPSGSVTGAWPANAPATGGPTSSNLGTPWLGLKA